MERQLIIKTNILDSKEFVNIKELKDILNTSQNTIYRLCETNELKKYKFLGKCWFKQQK
jgi:transcriptional antiterminator